MTKIKVFVLVGLILVFAGAIVYNGVVNSFGDTASDSVEQTLALPAPQVSLKTLDNRTFDNFGAFEEETLIVNFWASWCTPCVVELPLLLQTVAKANGKVGLIAISIDNQVEQMKDFLAKLDQQNSGLVYSPHVYWVWDEGKEISLNTFNVLKVPETIVLDKERMMIDKIVGPVTEETLRGIK